MEERRKPLDIPTNASDRNDYIQGIGKKEVLIIVVVMVASMVVAVIIYSIWQDMMAAAGTMFFLNAGTVMAVRRDIYNETVGDRIRIMAAYVKMQKQYKYIQQDFLEVLTSGQEDGDNGK